MDFANWSTLQWLAAGLLIAGSVIGFFMWMHMKRREFRKAVKGKVLVELLRANNSVDEALYEYERNKVAIPDTQGKKKTLYFMRRDAGWNAWWPTSGLLKALGTQVRKFHFIEGDPEPQCKRIDEPVVTAKTLMNVFEERFTEVIANVTARMEQMQRAMSQVLNPMFLYVMLAIAVGAAIAAAFLAWQLKSSVDAILQALGVG